MKRGVYSTITFRWDDSNATHQQMKENIPECWKEEVQSSSRKS